MHIYDGATRNRENSNVLRLGCKRDEATLRTEVEVVAPNYSLIRCIANKVCCQVGLSHTSCECCVLLRLIKQIQLHAAEPYGFLVTSLGLVARHL